MTDQQLETALNAFVEAHGDSATALTGFADCVLGLGERCGQPMVLVYDRACLLSRLIADGMNEEEAEEYISCNITGAWVGDQTPVVMVRFYPEDWMESADAHPDV